MDIGLSRGPAIARTSLFSPQSGAEAGQKPGVGEARGVSAVERPQVATQRALDAQGPQALGPEPQRRPFVNRSLGEGKAHPDQGELRPLGEKAPGEAKEAQGEAKEAKGEEKAPGLKSSDAELSEDEKRVVEQLQRRDRAVRAHEAAHLAAAGGYAAGGPSYTTQQGPDGRSYAIGGEVPIDMSAERTPEATLRKAQTIRAAAMAPADPSGADKAIAAAASQMAQAAQAQMAEEAALAAEEMSAAAEPEDSPEPPPPPEPKEAKAPEPELRRTEGSEDPRRPEAPAPEAAQAPAESSEPRASSTEGFAQLKESLSQTTATDKKQAARNKRGQISKAYVAVASTPARATLRCAACSGFH